MVRCLIIFSLMPGMTIGDTFAQTVLFEDVAITSKLGFQHLSPLSPERHIHLFMGSGLAWSDFDRDGEFDLIFCQGSASPHTRQGAEPSVEIWRGQFAQNRTYSEVTTNAGFPGSAYSFGISVSDFDNDGFADLFVTAFL